MGRGSSDAGREPIWTTLRLRLQGAEDPTVAVLVWLMLFAGAGVFVWSIVDHNDKIRDAGLAALGGILLLLTAYFTARNLQINARAAFTEQLDASVGVALRARAGQAGGGSEDAAANEAPHPLPG